MELTQSYLKSVLNYDPDTGIFVWLISRSGIPAGRRAGSPNSAGYIHISINGRLYKAHRLAFLYMDGVFPAEDVDHINRITGDNRWENLRSVSTIENTRNSRLSKRSTSGVAGVSWRKDTNKWKAHIGLPAGKLNICSTDDFFEAVCARKSAENKHGFHPNHGRNV